MIVADTNLITYLLVEGPMLNLAEQVLRQDPDWTAPALWRSEFRNVLAGFMRRGQLSLENAQEYWRQADSLILTAEPEPATEPASIAVLELAHGSGCTAYDCEFVALARNLGIPLVTSDKQVLAAFPKVALNLGAFVRIV
jgi:predicted nucleic acid-binding protein